MPDQPKDPIDPKNFLLPKKETGPSPLSAQRINAGALLEQEINAELPKPKAAEQKIPPSGEMNTTPTPPVGTSVPPAGQTFSPAIPPAPAPAPKPEPKKEESTVHAVQTYTTDISSVMKSGTVSAVTIAAAEAERRAKPKEGESAVVSTLTQDEKMSRWRIALIIGGAVLILAALGLVATLLLRAAPQPPATTAATTSFMPVDQTITVAAGATRDILMSNLEVAREQVGLAVGLVTQLQVNLSAQDLLSTLSPDIPPDFLRTLSPEYLLGVHSFDENQAFLVLRVDSYQLAYAGLLAWEPYMQGELSPLFTRKPSPHLPSQDTASSTASTTPDFIKTGFTDKVVENHDARVVVNSAGDILLMWTFLDRNTVVIATNEYTLREVIRRVSTATLAP